MYEGRVEKGLQYETGKKPIKWEEHREVNCAPCDLYAAVKDSEKSKGKNHWHWPPCLSEQHLKTPN